MVVELSKPTLGIEGSKAFQVSDKKSISSWNEQGTSRLDHVVCSLEIFLCSWCQVATFKVKRPSVYQRNDESTQVVGSAKSSLGHLLGLSRAALLQKGDSGSVGINLFSQASSAGQSDIVCILTTLIFKVVLKFVNRSICVNADV